MCDLNVLAPGHWLSFYFKGQDGIQKAESVH